MHLDIGTSKICRVGWQAGNLSNVLIEVLRLYTAKVPLAKQEVSLLFSESLQLIG